MKASRCNESSHRNSRGLALSFILVLFAGSRHLDFAMIVEIARKGSSSEDNL
jgi:hypothetical protein